MVINNETIIKDDNPLIRKRSEDVKLPLSDEDKEILLTMHKYVDESTIDEIAKEKNLRPAVGSQLISHIL